ncbi:MAG: [FeFe] hydrogenase H-cluster radical SAM maturase HydE [Provencibacterium sp.]|jgi:biotin synthase|nr:[FeFe] hydrogenase H-cluster radical SAM maturase HydE [Provencibacterium sp.]
MNGTGMLIEKLAREGNLTDGELEMLIRERTPESAAALAAAARAVREKIYGRAVYIRGLIEFTNICKNDCLYCGIRRSNRRASRYRLSEEEILGCCETGYPLGFRTFVLQGGEDPYFTDERLSAVVRSIKRRFPDCAVTLSCGERGRESYRRLFEAGADRYLLRHETAAPEHYRKLHPPAMEFERRMQCLRDLKDIGYQTGCGFMVGSPFQTVEDIVRDLRFIRSFRPHMVGIGPYLSHPDTPFCSQPDGTAELTLFLLSVIRLLLPGVLLPATTALGTVMAGGREEGILRGANVVMPNLSPPSVRGKYLLYHDKLSSGAEAAENLRELSRSIEGTGYTVTAGRGDSLLADG